MGYSNNKWRKILTILMIINLCFILFAKITKVFGSFIVDVPDTENTLELPDFFKDYNFLVSIRFNSGYNKYALKIALSSLDNKYYTNINSGTIFVEKQDTLKYIAINAGNNSGFPDFNSMQTYFNTLTINSFTDLSVTAQGNTNVDFNSALIENGTIKYISNTNIYNGFTGIENNDIYFNQNAVVFSAPSFDNVTEIENGNPDGVFISPADYSKDDNLYFHLLEINTGLSSPDSSIYYYSDKTFILNKDSDYFSTWYDPSIDGFYYYIPRYKLGLTQNTSYLYVLNNSKKQIQNSHGLYEKDINNGVYDVVQSDTAGVITATEEESDRMRNIEATISQNQQTTNNINDALNNTTITNETQTDVDTNLNFNNNAPEFSSIFNGFFSRLTSTISDLGNYQDTDVITVYLPIPFTNNTIPIRSDILFSNQNNNFLRNIATLLWYFIFGRYFLYFLINTYWLITNGQFFDNYLTQKEAITGDML